MKEQQKRAIEIIRNYDGPPVRVMEVCGTHTHEIFRLGVRKILPSKVELISGPGCPVCVTPADFIDEAVWLALEKGVTVCTFGDLIRVPGSEKSLADARGLGGKIQMVYSPADAVTYAKAHPREQVVFLSVGFETTTPACCLSVKMAREEKLTNYALLTANKTMPGAYGMLKDSADVFLYPGHVNAITGNELNRRLVREEGISGVVTGFTASEILAAFALLLTKFPEGQPFFINAYPRVVKEDGNPAARKMVEEYMEPCDSCWRGLGVIPGSGLRLKDCLASFDARKKYAVPKMKGHTNPGCRCGEVLKGNCRPTDCKLFGKTCTPLHPVGACMVSNEGACSAYFQYETR
ncbi:MAG: hydrogenase formation protein HypD [Eubacterium sp.]|nr:hydrogenase formation protein HypD [Eubacterium sp.]MDD7209540.1 hydrogenase formation protein HypD [Lachnospiraceae bacterium]MDY5498424.1 hydrogenase formation protein HypD [Anaerobutyricum sp.]